MEGQRIRVVHYLNQFYGQVGVEEKADIGPLYLAGPAGPARAVSDILGQAGEVVATVICGDNYFAEQLEQAGGEVIQLIRKHSPHLVLAGPAFNAGRYGIACGEVCRRVGQELGLPAVTGMYA